MRQLAIYVVFVATLSCQRIAIAQGALHDPDRVRAVVAEMLADAQGRSSLLQSAGSAGRDGGFFLRSPDGGFRLELRGRLQLRYVATFTDGDTPSVDDFEPGFQTRRTQLFFAGHAFDPNLSYQVTASLSRITGAASVTTARIAYDLGAGAEITLGQFKLPFLREESLSAGRQLAAERTITSRIFTQGRSQGVQLALSRGDTTLYAAFSDGLNSVNTDFDTDPADWALTGRVERVVEGAVRQFGDFTSRQGNGFGLLLGAAAHFERSPDAVATGTEDLLTWTADAQAEGDGWSAYASVVGRHDSVGAAGGEAFDLGVTAQGGFYVAPDWEPFARYEFLLPDADRAGSDPAHVVTLGINRYLHGHAAKLTLDAQFFFEGSAGNELLDTDTRVGFVNNGAGDHEVVLRAQFQLQF